MGHPIPGAANLAVLSGSPVVSCVTNRCQILRKHPKCKGKRLRLLTVDGVRVWVCTQCYEDWRANCGEIRHCQPETAAAPFR